MGFQKKKKKKGIEEVFEEIMVENFSKLLKDINSQIQDQQTPNNIKTNKQAKSSLTYIIVKQWKTNNELNQNILKAMGASKGGRRHIFYIRRE